ncbi:hypothetical protein EV13_2492 [Prochlorococcus sp. MIT 0702]|nr:hypothetical protein EV12_2277 [Prochlorococcus sp. MIT 0701]KGG26360.1 hypothetical protein EV13_2492 [Prochlorococcus sp. MIT 0702]
MHGQHETGGAPFESTLFGWQRLTMSLYSSPQALLAVCG